MNGKYLVAVALLAVLAVGFGLASMAAPMSQLVSPQQSSSSSDSVTHFMNPPTYNSSWLDITDKAGQYFNITHNLNSTDVIVEITGRTIVDGRAHQRHLGGTDYVQGWNRTYGGGNDEAATSVVQTVDGGYAIAGWTASFGAGRDDFWLVKTDAGGNVEWNQTYGGTGNDDAYSVIQTSDGGYAMAGWTESFGAGGWDFWLIKTDQAGNAQPGFKFGLAWIDSTADTITLYRGATDPYWNYVRVRMWLIQEPTWMFGDINMDGVVDAKDLAIIGKNYGKTFSLLSLTGIIAIAGIYIYKKRKQPK